MPEPPLVRARAVVRSPPTEVPAAWEDPLTAPVVVTGPESYPPTFPIKVPAAGDPGTTGIGLAADTGSQEGGAVMGPLPL